MFDVRRSTFCPFSAMPTTLKIQPRYYRWHVDSGMEWTEQNTGYARLDWEIPLPQAALVLLDVWDRHYLRDPEERAEEIIQNRLVPLVAACREAGLRLIHAPSPGYRLAQSHPNWVNLADKDEISPTDDPAWPPAAFRSKTGPYGQFARPHEPREQEIRDRVSRRTMHPAVQPEKDEPVVAYGEELHRYGKQHGLLFLFYAGFNTNACILHRDYGTLEMAKRGYEVVIVRDCTTGMESPETQAGLWHTRVAIQILEMFGKYSISSGELIAGLAAGE
jgi:nicotinamidase-related amidase